MTFPGFQLLCILFLLQASSFHYARWSPEGGKLLITTHGGEERTFLYEFSTRKLRPITVSEARGLEREWMPPASHRPRTIERGSSDSQAVLIQTRSAPGWRKLNREKWAEQPSLSPGGDLVVYEARDDAHAVLSSFVVVVDTSASRSRRLAQGTDPSWSPDGSKILFKTPIRGELHIATIDVRGGTPRILGAGVHPAWSPDGSRIAYMGERLGRADIWVMKADGTTKQCLTCGYQ